MENTNDGSNKASYSGSKKIFEFFNSSLGIWILSTIFIGLVTFSYQKISVHSKEEHDKTLLIQNLETEISRRIYVFNKKLEELSTDTSYDNYPKRIEEAIRKINSNNCYVFAEFKKRKLSTLLYQLYVLLPEPNKPVVREAFEEMFLIEQFPSKMNKHTSNEKADAYLNKMLAFTKTNISRPGWNK